MATAQPGIFALGTRSHYQLEFVRRPGVDGPALIQALQCIREPAVTAGGGNIVVGFGPDVWREVAPVGEVPDGFEPFAPIDGLDGKHAPSTQHDVWIWVHGTGEDMTLDAARAIAAALAPVAEIGLEQRCFVYKDSRDLTGFIDGSANPPVGEAPEVAMVPEGKPGEAGSFVITQRWVHDLKSFHAQDIAEQEQVFARTKPDSIEFDDDAKPVTAHIARVEIEDEEGEELEIFRRSVPWGTVLEQGLYFLGFSADQSRFDRMLARMYGLEDGVRDHLLDFSTPSSGAYYFAPRLEVLNDLLG
jgi:putative iron-dependent peroxidase